MNESGQTKDGITFTGHYQDLEDAIEWAKTQDFYREPFALAGQSLGAASCLRYAGEFPNKVNTLIIAACPFIDGYNLVYADPMMKEIEKNGFYDKVSKSTGRTLHITKAFNEDLKRQDLTHYIVDVVAHTFIIQGLKDSQFIIENSEKIRDLLKSNKEYHPLNNVPHDLANTPETEKEFRECLDNIFEKINKTDSKDFESIMPTALHTLYPLIYTDIPYIKEMFEQLDKLGFPESLKNKSLALELEARYKLTDKLLAESKIDQVVELACGYTTRGLSLCHNNGKMRYFEVDLPDVVNTKTALLNRFTKIPDNLKIYEGNALDFDRLQHLCNLFRTKKPIAIINQGLMRYLNFDEKRKLAENIYKIISQNNGVWITCDVTPASWIKNQDKNMSNYNQNLTQVTDRNNPNWRFKDREHVTKFFEEIGFEIEWHDFTEAKPMLSSPKILGIPEDEIDKYLKGAVEVVMRPKKRN